MKLASTSLNGWFRAAGVALLVGAAQSIAQSIMMPAVAAAGPIFDEELLPSEQALVLKGKQVAHIEDVDGSAWPSVTVFQKTDATPEELLAVFSDYPLHATMFREKDGTGIVEATVAERIDPRTTHVNFTLTFSQVLGVSMDPEHYTTWNQLQSPSVEGTYGLDWRLVRSASNLIQDIRGTCRVEVLDGGVGSLLVYTQLIVPSSPMAGLLRNKAITQVKATVQSLLDQVNRERASDRATLARQLQTLRNALGQ